MAGIARDCMCRSADAWKIRMAAYAAGAASGCLNKVHGMNESLSRILQILSVNVFQKVSFNQLLVDFSTVSEEVGFSKQLIFNDL